jgi:hypothetical protein
MGNHLTITAPMLEGLISTGAGNYLEVRLTATDSGGLSKTVTRDVQPNRVNASFASNPSGLSLLINGETFTALRDAIRVQRLVRRSRPATRYRYRDNAELVHGHLHGHLHSLHGEWDLKRRDP